MGGCQRAKGLCRDSRCGEWDEEPEKQGEYVDGQQALQHIPHRQAGCKNKQYASDEGHGC